jgi:hypothetical protein
VTTPIRPTAWHAVRCLFEVDVGGREAGEPRTYEERVTIWRVDGFEVAIALAEAEAEEYAETVSSRYLGLAQAYVMKGEPPLDLDRAVTPARSTPRERQ